MSRVIIGSPWAPYGLRDDPFFQQPLQPTNDEDAPRPVSLFVGRDAELALLANQILGSSNSRAILQGDAGVGKTSFVNRLKTELAPHDVITHEEPVRVRAGMTAHQFIAELLKVLLQIHATLVADQGALRRARHAVKKEAGVDEESAFWRRVGRIIQGEDSMSVGASAFTVGVQRERVRIPAEVGDVSMFDEFRQAVAYLTNRGARNLLIHINNLENLALEAAEGAARLIQEVRDCFLVDYSHWLFVGTTGVEEHVFRASEQVSGIIPFAVTLEPLDQPHVAEILARRYQHLGTQVKLTPPVPADDAALLYQRYHGHLRTFLSLLSNAVQRRAAFAPGAPLSVEDVVSVMAPGFRETLERRIGTTDMHRLATALAGHSFDTEIRVTDIAKATGIKQPSASQLVQRLLAANVIRQSRTEGKSVYYRIGHGDLTIALDLA